MFIRRSWRLTVLIWALLSRAGWLQLTAWMVPEARRALYRAKGQQSAARRICRALRVRVTVEGDLAADGFPEGGAQLRVCNHIGQLDPWVLAAPMLVSFAGKAEMARWPVAGWICRMAGLVFVERDRRMATQDFVEAVQEKLRAGVPVLVFPEGTTSRDHVKPFKTGAFEAVAGFADQAVLPLYLQVVSVEGRPADGPLRESVTWADTDETMVANLWRILGLRSMHFALRVGTPIGTAEADRKALTRQAEAQVRAMHDEAVAS